MAHRDPRRPGCRMEGMTEPVGAEIEEVVGGGHVASESPRPPGRRRGPGPAMRAALLLGASAVAIFAIGLLGPRSASPDVAPGSPPPTTAPGSPAPAAVAPSPTAPVPLFRRSGAPLDDQHVLVEGRWMNLATGRAVTGTPTECANERVFVLGSGRIVCVAATVSRAPGSQVARFDLAAITLGATRADRTAPAPGLPPDAGAAPQALTTLVGRRDMAFGDPVAISVAPGPGPDDVLLAWAVVDEGGYEVGLDAFRLADTAGPAGRIGSWALGRAPNTGRDAVETLGDLAVATEFGGGSALVGWTEAGRGIAGPVRRLVVVPLTGAGRLVALPTSATRNLAPESADGPLRTGTPCGGPFGEGFGAGGTVYVVCPGPTAELRVLDARAAGTDARPGAVVGTARLEPGGTQVGTAWLAGNGIAVDRAGAVTYRWSPAAGTLWRIAVGPGGEASVTPLAVLPLRGYLDAIPGDEPPTPAGALPVLSFDAARGRLYALDAPVAGTGGRAVVHLIDVARWSHSASFTVADSGTRAIALSPDGALLYASTAPRAAGGPPRSVGVAVLDASTGIERAYAGRLPAGAGGQLQSVVVR